MKHLVSSFLLVFLLSTACQQKDVAPPIAIGPVPSAAQMDWHKMEMNAFIHFTINTFTDLEWGMGSESPALFDPKGVDAEQWITVLKEAGFKGVILTCKHHDGFCLWPSAYTDHTIANSPILNGKADIVKAVSDACKKHGLKFGVYLSPWDRNHADYGSPAYITYYRNQLKELFTSYGPVFEMWFDGANGGTGYYGGANEKRSINGATYYDWPGTLDLVRSMEPEVIFFSDAGPGVRWVGNEKGVAGETNWNTIRTDSIFAGKSGIEKLLNTGEEEGDKWIPAETDVSIRPGWFYHAREDSLVKSPAKLFEIYLTSVGRGSTLLLNVPPDRRGRFHENDVQSLKGFREMLDQEFGKDLAQEAKLSASNVRGDNEMFGTKNLTDDNFETYWATEDDEVTGSFEISFSGSKTIKYVMLQEYIPLGQRVRTFTVQYKKNGEWEEAAAGTTIGYKRILQIYPVETDALKVSITSSKGCPVISTAAVY